MKPERSMPKEPRSTASVHGSRPAVPLSRKLERNLLGYAAASAGLIAFACPAGAQIVYTPSNIPLGTGGGGGVITQLDVNNDGTPDFAISNYSYVTMGLGAEYLKISRDQAGNEIVGAYVGSTNNRRIMAAGLDSGIKIGPDAKFLSSAKGFYLAAVFLGTSAPPPFGSWLSVETAYLGLKFVVNGEVHYGWARIKLTAPGFFSTGSIYGYAYEATPNKPIFTGQTTGAAPNKQIEATAATRAFDHCMQTLGVLAAGAPPAVWRSLPIAKCLPQSQ